MKKIFLSLLITFPVALMAQVKVDRTHAPKPGPAPIIKVGEPAAFTLANGLKSICCAKYKITTGIRYINYRA